MVGQHECSSSRIDQFRKRRHFDGALERNFDIVNKSKSWWNIQRVRTKTKWKDLDEFSFFSALIRILHETICRLLTNSRENRGQTNEILTALISDYFYLLLNIVENGEQFKISSEKVWTFLQAKLINPTSGSYWFASEILLDLVEFRRTSEFTGLL